MHYELDDMYDILNEYKEQDARQAIQRQETVNHEKNEVPESHLTAQAVSANSVQQDDFSIEERFSPQNDYETVMPVSEKPDCTKSSGRVMRVENVGFKRDDNKKASANETCALRDIPRCLVEMARKSFPHAPNYTAVSAFLYAHRDKESEDIDYSSVPDNVKELARSYERKNEAMRTSADIRRINDTLRTLSKASDEVILALSYLVYDANGFRRTEPAHPGEIDFYDPGIQRVTEQLERISDKLCSERSYQQGKKKNMYGQKGQV